ncbi:MAG: sigma 54-interacting transcriptional regulator, partial [Terriglobales bacterium]
MQRLEALAEFGTLLTSKLCDQELFLAISDFLRKTVRPDFAGIALYDESISQRRVYALDFEIAQRVVGSEVRVAVTEEAWGSAFLNADTIVYDRERLSASQSSYLMQLLQAGIQSLGCFPLTTPKGTLGTFNLGWRQPSEFLAEEIAFLKHFASRIASVLDSVGAYREIARLSDKLRGKKVSLESEIQSTQNFEEVIGDSPALKRVLAQVQTVAPSDATVLILGETGTGKELIARGIHRMSARKGAP